MTMVFTIDEVIDILAAAHRASDREGIDRGTIGYLLDQFVEDLHGKDWQRAVDRYDDLIR